jgi:hypothetical protein
MAVRAGVGARKPATAAPPRPGVSDDLVRVGSRIVQCFVLVIGIGVAISVLGADVAPLQTAAITTPVHATTHRLSERLTRNSQVGRRRL